MNSRLAYTSVLTGSRFGVVSNGFVPRVPAIEVRSPAAVHGSPLWRVQMRQAGPLRVSYLRALPICAQESLAQKRLEQWARQTAGQALIFPVGQVGRISALKPLLFELGLVDLLDLVVQGLEDSPCVRHALFAVAKRCASCLGRRATARKAVT